MASRVTQVRQTKGNKSEVSKVGTKGSDSRRNRKSLPCLEMILLLDRDYREKAASNKLKKIAPKKLNPESKAWLPVMNVERGGMAPYAALLQRKKRLQ